MWFDFIVEQNNFYLFGDTTNTYNLQLLEQVVRYGDY